MNTLDGGMSLHTHRALANIAPSLGIDPPEWMFAAVCASTDPEVFYPDKGGSTAPAKRICAGCPAIVECLQYALDNRERWGVWGGASERERRRLERAGGPVGGVECPECAQWVSVKGLGAHRNRLHGIRRGAA